MGSPAADLKEKGDNEAYRDETRQHRVTLSRDYYLGKYEVTKGQFARFAAAAGYRTEAERDGAGGCGFNSTTGEREGRKPEYTWRNTGWEQTDRHPVVNVTWDDAVAFCGWVGKASGRAVRLPSEAEWEYACRGGTATRFVAGDAAGTLEGYANVADRSTRAKLPAWPTVDFDDGHAFSAPAGKFKPNGFGLYDMAGNAWEWTGDWEGAYRSEAVTDPTGPSSGSFRVFRGGCWSRFAANCRSARRGGDIPSHRSDFLGFRLALVPSGR